MYNNSTCSSLSLKIILITFKITFGYEEFPIPEFLHAETW